MIKRFKISRDRAELGFILLIRPYVFRMTAIGQEASSRIDHTKMS